MSMAFWKQQQWWWYDIIAAKCVARCCHAKQGLADSFEKRSEQTELTCSICCLLARVRPRRQRAYPMVTSDGILARKRGNNNERKQKNYSWRRVSVGRTWGDKKWNTKVDVMAERQHKKQSMLPDYRSPLTKEWRLCVCVCVCALAAIRPKPDELSS